MNKRVGLLVLSLLFALTLFCSCGEADKEYEQCQELQEERDQAEAARFEQQEEEGLIANAIDQNPEAIPWEEAYNHTNEYVTICGIVKDVDTESADSDPIFIDIGDVYPETRVTGVIWGEYQNAFPNVESYLGEIVYVEGELYDYNGTPSIKLTDLSQITVVK